MTQDEPRHVKAARATELRGIQHRLFRIDVELADQHEMITDMRKDLENRSLSDEELQAVVGALDTRVAVIEERLERMADYMNHLKTKDKK